MVAAPDAGLVAMMMMTCSLSAKRRWVVPGRVGMFFAFNVREIVLRLPARGSNTPANLFFAVRMTKTHAESDGDKRRSGMRFVPAKTARFPVGTVSAD